MKTMTTIVSIHKYDGGRTCDWEETPFERALFRMGYTGFTLFPDKRTEDSKKMLIHLQHDNGGAFAIMFDNTDERKAQEDIFQLCTQARPLGLIP